MKLICSPVILTKQFLMNLTRGLYLEEFRPGIIYVANAYIGEEELQKSIEWISCNILHPSLLDVKETDEKWDGKFIFNINDGDLCIEQDPEEGWMVKLTRDMHNFQFKFINTLTDRQWKMKIMFAGIEETINKMEETKRIFKEWLTLR